jgi:membrane-bound serine protease (ClpP class)
MTMNSMSEGKLARFPALASVWAALTVLAAVALVGLAPGRTLAGGAGQEAPPPAERPGDAIGAAEVAESAPPAESRLAVIIPIHDSPISDITVESTRRRLAEAKTLGAKVIVFELDTPGGYVHSAIAVADLIKNLPKEVRSVAWVNTNAHSGGAMVAVACDEIVMARSSRIGDSQVIMGSPIPGAGATAVSDDLKPKANTPVVNEFLASARRNGYSEALSRAFVLPELEVWWLENIETGEREFVLGPEKERRFGETRQPAPVIAVPPADASGATRVVPSGPDTVLPASDDFVPKWKLVERYYDEVLEAELDVAQPVVDSTLLLEMSAGQAMAFGFSKGVVRDESDLRERYNLTSITRLDPTWSEGMVEFMTSPWIRGFLLVLILLGAYVEFHTPGVGVPGLTALICLAIFIGAPYLGGLANVWEVAFIIVGFVLIGLELFVIPGFGIAGISGIALLMVGLIASFAPDEPGRSFPLYIPTLPATTEALGTGLRVVVGAMLVSLVGMFGLSRVLPETPGLRKLIPANPTPSEVLVDDPYHGVARVGDVGRCETSLRPAGKARFGSVLVDVVSEGDLIGPGSQIEVVERRGSKVVVRAIV